MSLSSSLETTAVHRPFSLTIRTQTFRSSANRGGLTASMCPLKSLSCFAIPQWWLPLGEVPLVSPKDSHCDSEGVTAVEDADSMGFYGEPRRIEEVTANLCEFYEWVPYPTDSTDGEWMELIDSEQSLSTFSGDSENPIHYESTKNQIATNPLRENVKDL